MPDQTSLLQASLSGENPYERLLAPRFDYADLYTFSENKATPVYNWFYYKEGYSRDFVTKTLEQLEVPADSTVVDPFCGTGTTLLAARESGRPCAGIDILPLGVFVSRVKLEDGYDIPALEEAVRWLTNLRYSEPKTRLIDIRFIDMRKVYNPYARNDIAFFRENIMAVQDERTRNFLMLGLISVVSQASNVMKDGGVLRIVHKSHVPPVRHLLKTKLKRMVKDLKERGNLPKTDWRADIGDARALPMEDGSAGALITSPPYLNFVDYTKVYALELSLLLSNANELEGLRKRSLRSHISASYEREGPSAAMEKILSRVTLMDEGKDKIPEVVEGYLTDMKTSIDEAYRVLEPGGVAVYVVGNASLPGVTVDVDLMSAEMGEQAGFEAESVWVGSVRWAGVHGIEKERPARESAVILRKPA